jgi:hypothetical protein
MQVRDMHACASKASTRWFQKKAALLALSTHRERDGAPSEKKGGGGGKTSSLTLTEGGPRELVLVHLHVHALLV